MMPPPLPLPPSLLSRTLTANAYATATATATARYEQDIEALKGAEAQISLEIAREKQLIAEQKGKGTTDQGESIAPSASVDKLSAEDGAKRDSTMPRNSFSTIEDYNEMEKQKLASKVSGDLPLLCHANRLATLAISTATLTVSAIFATLTPSPPGPTLPITTGSSPQRHGTETKRCHGGVRGSEEFEASAALRDQ